MNEIKLPPLPEPDSYLFQHEETGLSEYVSSQQVEWGFEKANPRWKKIHGAFTEQQLKAYATAALQSRDLEGTAALLAALEDSTQSMKAVLAQERIKAVAKRVLSRSIDMADKAINHARRIEGELK